METILLPLDGSPLAEQAVPVAGRLAALLGARIRLLQVIPPVAGEGIAPNDLPPLVDVEERRAREHLQRQAAVLGDLPVELVVLVSAGPAQEIIRYLRDAPVDYVVMATHGHSGVHQLVSGSVTEAVLRSGLAPVVAVRPRGVA